MYERIAQYISVNIIKLMQQTTKTISKQIRESLDYFLFSKKYNEALVEINKLIELSGGQLSLSGEQLKLYAERAKIFSNLQRYEECIRDCGQVLQKSDKMESMSKNNFEVHQLMIKAHLELNQIQVNTYLRCMYLIKCIQLADRHFQQMIQHNLQLKSIFSLKDLLTKLKSYEADKLSNQEQTTMTEMKAWLYAAGAHYDKLKVVKMDQDYRGVIATKTIKKKQKIVSIPRSHLITLEMAKLNSINSFLIQNKIELLSPKHTYISIYLLQEKAKPHSQWKHYLDILPQDHSTFPINYTIEELNQLVGSSFLYQIREKVLDLKKDYDTLFVGCQMFRKYTFQEFCWARMMVGSRIFGLFIDGLKTEILAPFADMLNHKVPKETSWNFHQEDNSFVIESLKDIEVGQEVFDSYGKKCNSRFLLNYAFVIPNNKENQICIRVEIQEIDLHFTKKLSMLKSKQESVKIYRISSSLDQNIFFEMMGFYRFRNITSIDTLNVLEKISGVHLQKQSYLPSRTPPISVELQLKIWQDLKSYCQSALDGYGSTLTEDRKLLQKKDISENERNILILRSGEKQLFEEYIIHSNEIIDLLSSGYQLSMARMKTLGEKKWFKYLEKILNLMPYDRKKKGEGHEETENHKSDSILLLQEGADEGQDEIEPDYENQCNQ